MVILRLFLTLLLWGIVLSIPFGIRRHNHKKNMQSIKDMDIALANSGKLKTRFRNDIAKFRAIDADPYLYHGINVARNSYVRGMKPAAEDPEIFHCRLQHMLQEGILYSGWLAVALVGEQYYDRLSKLARRYVDEWILAWPTDQRPLNRKSMVSIRLAPECVEVLNTDCEILARSCLDVDN